jgi:hypothetical protein
LEKSHKALTQAGFKVVGQKGRSIFLINGKYKLTVPSIIQSRKHASLYHTTGRINKGRILLDLQENNFEVGAFGGIWTRDHYLTKEPKSLTQ